MILADRGGRSPGWHGRTGAGQGRLAGATAERAGAGVKVAAVITQGRAVGLTLAWL